ncbi:MAG: hypothetical protein Kow0068_26580 [Marinilabiliales bacterium]
MVFAVKVYSQNKLTYREIDSLSYNYLLNNDWKNLKKISKEAINEKIDYYYLRLRYGIALYNRKSYAGAAKQFENAYKLNSYDTLLQEYLYYSYLLSGQYEKLEYYKDGISKSFKNKLGLKDNNIKSIFFETDIFINKDYTTLKEMDIYSNYVVNDQMFPVYSSNNMFYLVHKLGDKSTLSHGLTYYYSDKIQRIQEIIGRISQYNSYTSQIQYYIKADFTFNHGLKLNMATHFIGVKSLYEDITLLSQPGTILKRPYFSEGIYKNTDKIYYLSLSKRSGYYYMQASAASGKLNNILQRQFNFNMIIYPLGNEHFFLGNNLISLFQKQKNQLLFMPVIGLKYKNLSVSTSYIEGDIENYHENEALIVYNGIDIIKKKYTIMVNCKLSKKLSLDAGYQYINYESWIDMYGLDMNIYRKYYSYNINMFSIGFLYNF